MSPQTKDRAGVPWKEVWEDPRLQDLPCKVETNGRAQIIMSPTYAWQGKFAFRCTQRPQEMLPDGESSVEMAIQTTKETKGADAVWCTTARWQQIKDACNVTVVPEICVEVRSPTNPDAEMAEKRALYFEAEAEEVWICDEDGQITFYDAEGGTPPDVCPHSDGNRSVGIARLHTGCEGVVENLLSSSFSNLPPPHEG